MSTVISIQARMGSTRLPGKVLLSIGQKRTLDWIHERCASSAIGDVWVTTSMADADEAIVSWCERNDVPHVRGPETDLLERHLLVAEQSDAEIVVRINGDCPFVPATEIQRVHTVHQSHDGQYTTNHTGTVPHGINVDVLSTVILQQLRAEGHSHPVAPLRQENDQRTTESAEWTDYEDAELTLDTPSDYWRLVDAVKAVGSDPQEVARWIDD
jgi:spore coat polysaccharide biosynthesis protein SpsF